MAPHYNVIIGAEINGRIGLQVTVLTGLGRMASKCRAAPHCQLKNLTRIMEEERSLRSNNRSTTPREALFGSGQIGVSFRLRGHRG